MESEIRIQMSLTECDQISAQDVNSLTNWFEEVIFEKFGRSPSHHRFASNNLVIEYKMGVRKL